jgi:hypothetical protein
MVRPMSDSSNFWVLMVNKRVDLSILINTRFQVYGDIMSELVKITSDKYSDATYVSSTSEEVKFNFYHVAQVISAEESGGKVSILWEEILQLADIIKEMKNGH